ncbi:MAG: GGDEF domain-containing protein, partial [Oscillospiraceae bacterium]|nr:GGDEF domain-containing protein [Oscillospiraceae bacterium]
VNDTYGHAVGDDVLKKFSKTCEKFLDPEKCKLGRWGGEEFIGIYKGITGDEIEKLAEELRSVIEKRGFDMVGHITSSFGVIEVYSDESAEDAFKRVDEALYAAKQGGRNRVVRGL